MTLLRRVLKIACLVSLGLASTASARPSIWIVAKSPRTPEEHRLLRSFERFLLGKASARDEIVVHRAVVAYLEGEPYRDVRLEYLAARIRFEATRRAEPQVIERLSAALSRAPDSPLAPQGALDLAHMLARRGRLSSALDEYTRALRDSWQPDQRAEALRGRGNLRMQMGDMARSVRDYRRAVRSARSTTALALARFGLGVAFERGGNRSRAFVEVRKAHAMGVRGNAFSAGSALELPDALFAPELERHYAMGLTELALGMARDNADEARAHLKRALAHFDEYLKHARSERHRYRSNGARLRDGARAALDRLRAPESPDAP